MRQITPVFSAFMLALVAFLVIGPGGAAQHAADTREANTTAGVPMFRTDSPRTGVVTEPGPKGEPVERWRIDTGIGDQSTPAVVDGVLYVGSNDGFGGYLSAYEIETEKEQWHFAINPSHAVMHSSPAVIDGVAYVGSGNGFLYALDAETGGERWRFRTGDAVLSSPAVVDGVIYIGSNDGNLYGVDAGSGEELWQFETGDAVWSAPAVVEGAVYFGSKDGVLYSIDAASGTEQWQFSTGDEVVSSPPVADGIVYIGSDDDNLYAVDAEPKAASSAGSSRPETMSWLRQQWRTVRFTSAAWITSSMPWMRSVARNDGDSELKAVYSGLQWWWEALFISVSVISTRSAAPLRRTRLLDRRPSTTSQCRSPLMRT
jgi:hypothetical protein